jgi:hypothetical protein
MEPDEYMYSVIIYPNGSILLSNAFRYIGSSTNCVDFILDMRRQYPNAKWDVDTLRQHHAEPT